LKTYVLKRLLLMIPTLFGVSVVVFVIVSTAPAPPITQQVPTAEAGREAGEAGEVPHAVKVFRAQYGLNKPVALNLYYEIEKRDVQRALEDALDEEGTRTIKVKSEAQEQLIKWDEYATSALMELLTETGGRLRDSAMNWLVKGAKRVAIAAEGGTVSPKRARLNTAIAKENEILDLYAWEAGDPEMRKEAGVGALQAWYRGARARYPEGADTEEVRRALRDEDQAALVGLGDKAVPGLVAIILEEEGDQDRAIPWLVRLGARPEQGDEVEKTRTRLLNEALRKLEYNASDPDATKEASVLLVRDWWEGTARRWDYGGLRWLRVLLLETRFAIYWGNLLRFDLGESLKHKVPVTTLIFERLKYSLTIAVTALILAYLISVPLGILSAKIHGSFPERAMALFVFALYSLPSFYVATLVIHYLAEGQPKSVAEWIPSSRFESLDAWKLPTLEWIKDIAWHVVAPIFCLTYASLAALSRYAKVGILNVIRSDYVRTARAKGLGEFTVTMKHAARNGLIPIITLLGTTLPRIVGGSFIIEVIFGIPGFGLLMVQSIFDRDYNVIVGNSLIVAVLTMLGILLSDLLYAIVDPRISYS
jgi:peptide/nickel transport system permease protein